MSDYKLIPLTQGYSTKADTHNFEWLNQWKWRPLKGPVTIYAYRSLWIPGKGTGPSVYMHRVILAKMLGRELQKMNTLTTSTLMASAIWKATYGLPPQSKT